jgi:hypothetical protein
MHTTQVLELPFPFNANHLEPDLRYGEGGLRLGMLYLEEGRKRSAWLRFVKARAFRWRAELYCTSWHVEAFDRVLEVHDSDWVAELLERSNENYGAQFHWILRHFIVYIDSFGCLEVIAESVVLETGDVTTQYS